jgi:hypothetical protein
MPVGDHNFAAQSHQQLYDKIHRNTNGSSADATNDAWNSFRAVMANAKAEVESALRDAKVVWTGAAGESFGGGVAPLVQWAEGARAAGVDTHNAFQAQQSYYAGTRDRMPEPVKVSSTANDDVFGIPAKFTHLVGGQTDQDIEEQKANEAKREAVRVMGNYRSGAVEAVSSIGTFTEPPQVTLDVAQPEVEQSEAQQQYSQEFNKRLGTDNTTNDQSVIPPQQQQQQQPDVVAPPTTVPQGNDDTTHVSDATPPLLTRPGPAPIIPPQHPGPMAYPPHNTLPPEWARDRFFRRGTPTEKPTGNVQRGGPGVGTPKLGTGGTPGQTGQQPGRGPVSGVGAGEPHASGRPGAGSAGARGAAGSPGMGMAGAPQGKSGEEDKEHKAAPYLEEIEDIWGENDILVAPPVLGDDQQ